MEEIIFLKEKISNLEKEIEKLSIQFELFKLKQKADYKYPIYKETKFYNPVAIKNITE